MPSESGTPAPGEGAGVPDEFSSAGANNSEESQLPQANVAFGHLPDIYDERRRQLLDAVIGYAQLGWRAFPVCWVDDDGTCGAEKQIRTHRGCVSPGKRPLFDDWPDRATADPVVAAEWWRQPNSAMETEEWYPLANIGLVLGEASGIFALDIDPEHGGDVRLEQLEQLHGPLPPTRVHGTGGGGMHYLFAHPGFRVFNLKPWGKDAGLDIKGDRGFIVAPPSRSSKGEYTVAPLMAETEALPAPEWILEELRKADREQRGDRGIEDRVLPNRLISKYVEAAMGGEHAALAHAPAGDRNNQLFRSAAALGGLGAHGFIREKDAELLLRDAATRNGYITDDGLAAFRATFHSGWGTGMENPRDLTGVGSLADNEWQLFPQDELGLADRLVHYFGDQLRWVEEWQTWMSYASGQWSRQFSTEAEAKAQAMLRLLRRFESPHYEAEPGQDGESPRQKFEAWLRRVSTYGKISATARLARGVPQLQAIAGQFDDKPSLLNVGNGIVNLANGNLGRHDPDMMMTLKAGAPYNSEARCPQWDAFLARVQPDPEVRAYLQRIVGYSATGSIREQVFFLHHGSGANGKSVFHEVISHVLGSYVQSVPVEALMVSGSDRIPNDIARMVGRRYMTASETKAGKFLDEQRLKQLTGGDTVSARFMRGEFFDFKPVGKIHLTTNQLPRLSEDRATWRRIHLIPWDQVIPPRERDGTLAERLIGEESEGILRWIVEGSIAWHRDGLMPPGTALEAKQEYQEGEETLGQWVRDCCLTGEDAGEQCAEKLTDGGTNTVLYAHYKLWMSNAGFQAVNQRNFTMELKNMGFAYVKSHGRRGFLGIRVRGEPPG